MFVDNLRLDVIATFQDNKQDHFNCAVWKSAIKSEKKLIKDVVNKYPTIQKSIKKNAKYYFGSWA